VTPEVRSVSSALVFPSLVLECVLRATSCRVLRLRGPGSFLVRVEAVPFGFVKTECILAATYTSS